jgi:hypothetical protein
MGTRYSKGIKFVATSLLTPLFVLLTDPSPAIAAYKQRVRDRELIIQQAKNLGLPEEQLLDPEGWQKKQEALQKQEYKRQLAWHLYRTQPPKENIDRLNQMVEETENAYALHAMAGLADDVTDLDVAVSGFDKDPQQAGMQTLALARSSFKFTDQTLDRLDHAVNEKLASLPLSVRVRHLEFMAKARTEFRPIAKGLELATLGAGAKADSWKKIRPATVKTLKPRLKRISTPRTPKPWPKDVRPEATVREAPEALTLFTPMMLQTQRAEFTPSAGQLVQRVTGGARVVVPLPTSLVDAYLAATLQPAIGAPVDADGAATLDAPLSAEIVAKAAALGNDPVRIFNFVHDTIDTEIYYGSRKGALGTLAEKGGNDVDQASLLVALLRAAGVPARYELVGLRLEPKHWKALTGVDTAPQAASMLATAGYKVTRTSQALIPGGPPQPHIDVFLVGVRAHVDYSNYRGQAGSRSGEKTWAPLLPALKSYSVQKPVDLRNGAQFKFRDYLNGLSSDSPLERWEDQLRQWALENNQECATLDAAMPIRTIVPEALPYLRADYPAPIQIELGTLAELPDSLRNSARLRLVSGGGAGLFDVTLRLADLYGKRVSITYEPATANDAQTIASFGGLEETPLYLVKLRAVLKVGNAVVASGPAQTAGSENKLKVELKTGDGVKNLIEHVSVAG